MTPDYETPWSANSAPAACFVLTPYGRPHLQHNAHDSVGNVVAGLSGLRSDHRIPPHKPELDRIMLDKPVSNLNRYRDVMR